MIDACLPFNCVNSVYYLPMIDAIARMRLEIRDLVFMHFEVISYLKLRSRLAWSCWWRRSMSFVLKRGL
jgi:hypothetical protein